ncbi:L-fucose:H+ symporter permease [Ruania halotolerans]|uniref:L-fucose:H+ symporter permease n=1 Tax=Ruania halotolerans TaxID=2897773 RepID=UPI001E33B3FB|nr:L-fucose:H+ symporter permease [Ruania halotolerans]UFU06423.1 L-fucose:H+ symporter permease [Ruania halotolerans]
MSSTPNDLDTTLGHERTRFLHPGMLVPFILVVTCFAAWGTAANMTDTLVSTFTSVFDDMSTVQATLVQSAYYGAYFLLALPAAFVNQRFNYKVGVLLGLGLAASGGFLFLPAATAQTFGFFLTAIFFLAAGLSILETSANPYVMSMGPESNATRRLNFAQAFNPVGTNTGVLLAALLIAPNLSTRTPEERDALPPGEREALLTSELDAVMTPYVGLAVVLVLIWIGIAVTKVPGLNVRASHEVDTRGASGRVKRLFTNTHYSFGVVAQFFNVAAQTCIWTFTITYARDQIGASPTTANWWLQASLVVFLVARFAMVALMGKIDSRVLMLTMTCLGVVLCLVAVTVPSMVGLVAVVALSACLSLLFPTIYGIALEGLGNDTKFGAAGLVMAIVGGATVPLLQGKLVDSVGSAFSYIVPAVCFVVIIGYAIYTLRAPRPIKETG